jgi:hypothetical protein
MFNAHHLYKHLSKIYGGKLDFKKICNDEHIVIMNEDLGEGMNGFYGCNGPFRVIVLNKKISYSERRDWGWHELYHHFKSINNTDPMLITRDERNATLFAALVRCPHIEVGDTIESVMERYSVSPDLALIRIEFELTKIAA